VLHYVLVSFPFIRSFLVLSVACVDGAGPDRLGYGIARWILSFAVGEGMRAKLMGVPLDPKF
jgi:hypothetical protein